MANAYLERLDWVTAPENSILILIDTLVDLHQKAGRFKTAENLLTKVIDSGGPTRQGGRGPRKGIANPGPPPSIGDLLDS